jgi:hypothetical protein
MNPPPTLGDLLGQSMRIPTPSMLPVMQQLLDVHKDEEAGSIRGITWSYQPSTIYILTNSTHTCSGRVFEVNGMRVEYHIFNEPHGAPSQ